MSYKKEIYQKKSSVSFRNFMVEESLKGQQSPPEERMVLKRGWSWREDNSEERVVLKRRWFWRVVLRRGWSEESGSWGEDGPEERVVLRRGWSWRDGVTEERIWFSGFVGKSLDRQHRSWVGIILQRNLKCNVPAFSFPWNLNVPTKVKWRAQAVSPSFGLSLLYFNKASGSLTTCISCTRNVSWFVFEIQGRLAFSRIRILYKFSLPYSLLFYPSLNFIRHHIHLQRLNTEAHVLRLLLD